ncbi:MAG: MerR family transcriptional regulator, partial [Cyanobacteria bacterium J06606_4]
MLIGELAKQSNLSKDTIRFYEKIGLLSAGERRAGSRVYKEFPPHTLMRLQLIRQAKKLGFTLSEIKGAIDSWED